MLMVCFFCASFLRAGSEAQRGYNFLAHSTTAPTAKTIGQRKAPGVRNTEDVNTQERLFRHDEFVRSPQRTQKLVNENTGGKPYNVLTGAVLPHPLKPSVPERTDRRRAHPSLIQEPFCHEETNFGFSRNNFA